MRWSARWAPTSTELQQHGADGIDQLLVSGRGDQRRRHSGYSNTASTTTQGTTPTAPSGLNASAVSASQINLTWSDNASNETGFVIERCQGAGCSNFAVVGTVGANVTSYNNTGLTASTSYSYRVAATNGAGTSPYSNTASATTQGTPPAPPFPIRINTGGPAFTDAAGQVWSADQAFSGGGTYQTSTAIAGTVDDALYQTVRFCHSCSYSITVPNGNYEVVLHFAEIWWTSANQRVFDVSIEGTVVIDNLDIAAQVGAFTALVQTFPATVADGTLDVSLVASTDHATIAAIEVRLAGSGPPPPTALVATAVSTSQINLTWSDNAANETGFVIERCQGAGCSNFAAARHGGREHDQLQQHRADGVDQLLVSGGGDQRRRHLRATRTRRRRRRRARSRPHRPAWRVGGVGEPDQPDLERQRGERDRLRRRALSRARGAATLRRRHGGREHDQLQQHRAGGVDQLLVSGRGDQRRRHLRLLEHGVGDDAGHAPGAHRPA